MKIEKIIACLLLNSALLGSCIKKDFETPPDTSELNPQVTTNCSIRDVSTIAAEMQQGEYRKLGDTTISGTVVADDRSGNFYKKIVIEDSTGGIVLLIDQSSIYNDYPIGRKVFVKVKDLVITNFRGLPEIGFDVTISSGSQQVTGIPSALVSDFIIKGSFPNEVKPLNVKLIDLLSNTGLYLNRLVKLDNVQFDGPHSGVVYASPSTMAGGTARTVKDCPNTGSIEMYNSGYATFQPLLTPKGKGSITGIFSIYNKAQLLIRDTADVKLDLDRECK